MCLESHIELWNHVGIVEISILFHFQWHESQRDGEPDSAEIGGCAGISLAKRSEKMDSEKGL